jgi:hypothetical protein
MLNALAIRYAAAISAIFFSVAASADDTGAGIPAAWYEDGLPILQFQKDPMRDRGWVLTRSGVFVFDFRSRQTTAHVPLPEWVWAGEAFSCLPDLALGPKGEALISSNVEPTLWRIDAVTLAVTRHPLVLDAHVTKDVGFTGLSFSQAQNAFYAVSHFGALWRIDPLLRRAQEIELSTPIRGACGVTSEPASMNRSRFMRLCVRGPQAGWTVNLAPDARSGHVFERPCRG